MDHLYQISHEELLLLSGLLRLPPPLALGPQPTADYSRATLNVALSVAAGSLAARGFLSPPDQTGTLPIPAPGIASALRLLSSAEGCLVLAASQGSRYVAGQVGIRADGEALLLISAQPGVYRLSTAHSYAAVIDRVVATIPQIPARLGAPIDAPSKALLAALDAAPAGAEAAMLPLRAAGMAADEAAHFARCLGHAPARQAIVALRGESNRRERRGTLAIVGSGAAWLADDDSRADLVALRPVGSAGLRSHVADLVAWLALM
jgi:hypothetical protein